MPDKREKESLTITVGDKIFIDAGFKKMTACVQLIDAVTNLITVIDEEGHQWVWEESSDTRILESMTTAPGGTFEIHPIMNITKID